jgi:hypothetical protein
MVGPASSYATATQLSSMSLAHTNFLITINWGTFSNIIQQVREIQEDHRKDGKSF